ncbi:hypothetical protein HMPREF2533_03325 [Bacteroides fragilis]|nr:hypothetical protein M074_3514 [Bacteroides fragilis str. DS-166]KXU43237.1 hypothetical protein HMPREF2530_03325 [Bacteroides fragilis]KXU43299.1 hypothetical protein HMPREF2533_03325 [Bacteroides fragilis]
MKAFSFVSYAIVFRLLKLKYLHKYNKKSGGRKPPLCYSCYSLRFFFV